MIIQNILCCMFPYILHSQLQNLSLVFDRTYFEGLEFFGLSPVLPRILALRSSRSDDLSVQMRQILSNALKVGTRTVELKFSNSFSTLQKEYFCRVFRDSVDESTLTSTYNCMLDMFEEPL